MSASLAVVSRSDRELVLTRVFDAPPDLVFDVWTNPQHVAQWWGPYGFTTTISEMNVEPGGDWRLVMHGPDGRDYRNHLVFLEVDRPAKLVYKHQPEPGTEPVSFQTTVTFENESGQTRVTMRMTFPNPKQLDYVIQTYHADEGGQQTLDRLRQHLADVRRFRISRTFDAPRQLVWEVYTQAEHLRHWWGPKGCELIVERLDLQVGGEFVYGMGGPNGSKMWGKFVYREITPPERLSFLSSFADQQGNVTRAPFFDNWPLEVMTVVTFEERDGRTTVNVEGCPVKATQGELERYYSMFGSMEQGFGGTFDQLGSYLASLS